MRMPSGTTVFADGEAVARHVAERIVSLSHSASGLAICLSGGSTPKVLYGMLASTYSGRMAWDAVHWFFGDERFVPPTDPDSNEHMVRAAMLDHAPIAPDHIHAMPTGLPTLDAAAHAYEAALRAFHAARPDQPLFDLVLLGIGDDGHTASLFPGKPAVDDLTHWVVAVPEAGLSPFVPRLSLTLPALGSSREVLFLAVGAAKHAILTRVAGGEDLPSARVRSRGAVRWLVDRAPADGSA
jgi:6-phosphogluconolactonase